MEILINQISILLAFINNNRNKKNMIISMIYAYPSWIIYKKTDF